MKKVMLIGVAICMALVLAAPAMAIDTKFSGQFYVKGYHNTNYNLNDNDASDSYMTMRLRVRTDFMVSDHLSLTTRFDALDNKRWGDSDNPPDAGNDNIDWDRAYMTIKGDYGAFNLGRMSGGTWGTSFNDTEGERDRIKYTRGMGDTTILAIYEKNVEGDEGATVSDQDHDVYYLAGYHKMEAVTFGLLWGYVNGKNDPTASSQYHALVPYFVGQTGPFSYQGELRYNGFGDKERDYADDQDYEQLAWNLEAGYSMDMFKFELGWVHVDGQGDDTDDIVGYGGAIGDDWEKIWILTGSTDDGTAGSLGSLGNLSTTGSGSGGPLPQHGADLFYGSVSVMPMEGLDVKFQIAYGQTDEDESYDGAVDANGNAITTSYDDEYGWEYDLFVNYKIYDNLDYAFIAAYLDAGDFWKEKAGIAGDDFEDNFHLYQMLRLKF